MTESSITGASCSFEASYFFQAQTNSTQKTMTLEMKMKIALKNPQLIAENEITSLESDLRSSASSPDDSTILMGLTMNGTFKTRSFGVVSQNTSMNMQMDIKTKAGTISLTSRYQSTAFDALLTLNSVNGGEMTGTLNGQPLDKDLKEELTKGLPAGNTMSRAKR